MRKNILRRGARASTLPMSIATWMRYEESDTIGMKRTAAEKTEMLYLKKLNLPKKLILNNNCLLYIKAKGSFVKFIEKERIKTRLDLPL